ncbi:MAG: hypothetical protein M1834_005446 [Cirrosporium novae-zelandiae]|nr:MAG: hypothetical protein M1834_005446 [Cirrosporium novae-zelandiae]
MQDSREFAHPELIQQQQQQQHDPQINNILSDMDGSYGWLRLNRDDVNTLLRRWDLDLGYDMNGRYFQENPFAIVKKYVRSDATLDYVKLSKWINLAHYMGFKLSVFHEKNWVGEGVLVDGADVQTLPFCGRWKEVATSTFYARRSIPSLQPWTG